MKTIVIAGIERGDFCYYVAKTLSHYSRTVIVIDNSLNKELFDCVQMKTGTMEDGVYIAKRRDVVYIKDVAYSPEFFDAFEYVIIYEGEVIDTEEIGKADYVFVMPDYTPLSIEKFKGIDGENVKYIMRDRAGKFNENSAAELLDINRDKIAGCIDYDPMDYAAYLSLLYNGSQKLNKTTVSPECAEAVTYVSALVSGKSTKEVSAVVKARRD